MSAELIVLTSKKQKKRFPLESGMTFIGSNPSADIIIEGKGIAPHQCTVFHCAELYIVSNQSSNTTTRLNGKYIQSMPLSHGDTVTFGKRKFPQLKFALSNDAILKLQAELIKSGLRVEEQAAIQPITEQLSIFEFDKGERKTSKGISYKLSRRLTEIVKKIALSSIRNYSEPRKMFVGAMKHIANYLKAEIIDLWALDSYTLASEQVFVYKTDRSDLISGVGAKISKTKDYAIKHSLLFNNALLYKHKNSENYFLCIPLRTNDYFAGAFVIKICSKKLKIKKAILIDSILLANLIVDIFKPHDMFREVRVNNAIAGHLRWHGIFYRRVDEIVHFVKNVFSVAHGSLSVISHSIETQDTKMLSNIWPVFTRNYERVLDFNRNLIIISRKIKLDLAHSDVNQLIQNVVDKWMLTLEKSDISLNLRLDSRLQKVRVDSESIILCINNLMSNACDALRICTKKSNEDKKNITVETELFRSEQYYCINCIDNGTGIESEHMPHITELFFSTKGTGGAGLGLAVVKSVMDAHGGLLRWQSAPTAGSIFSLNLPCNL